MMGQIEAPPQTSREASVTPQKPTQQPAPLDLRRGGQPPPNYDPNQHGEIAKVPHNAYPTDGMTMFCRTGPPSERSSGTNSGYRPSSRDSQSELSNPTSMSSQEPPSARQSPTKPTNGVALPGIGPDKQVQKKRSAFFSNSPFRRKSRHDKDRSSGPSQPPSRGTWDSSSKHTSPVKAAPQQQPQAQPQQQPPPQPQLLAQSQPQSPAVMGPGDRAPSPEPVDPRANFQLNVGNNVFDVASPEKRKSLQQSKSADDDLDPIARALADLKTSGKSPSSRVSADRYHGIASPAPSTAGAPPAYNDPSMKRLDAPQPAHTSAQMQRTTQKYIGQGQNMYRNRGSSPGPVSRNSVQSQDSARARSPTPRRSASPNVSPRVDTRMTQYNRGTSPSPSTYQSSSVRSRYSQSPSVATPPQRPGDAAYSPREYAPRSPNMAPRAVSPQPQYRQQSRPSSAGGMELQLSRGDMYGGGSGREAYSARGRDTARPISYYGDAASTGRSRSRTLAAAEPGRQFSRDGRPILHFGKSSNIPPHVSSLVLLTLSTARAMYSYAAAIPEELGFTKGDVLSVLRLQDDGWWEAEIASAPRRTGLVPSNYLQII